MALNFDMEAGDVLHIGTTTITLVHKTGRRSKLRVESKLDVTLEKGTEADAATRFERPSTPPSTPLFVRPSRQSSAGS